jgi:sulfur relay (sulfurtransferase) complex TusBCD TusD component (DsrE family)
VSQLCLSYVSAEGAMTVAELAKVLSMTEGAVAQQDPMRPARRRANCKLAQPLLSETGCKLQGCANCKLARAPRQSRSLLRRGVETELRQLRRPSSPDRFGLARSARDASDLAVPQPLP